MNPWLLPAVLTPAEDPPVVEVTVRVNLDDMLDAYAVAVADWNGRPAQTVNAPMAVVSGTFRFGPAVLALLVIVVGMPNGTAGTGPLMDWVRWLTGLAIPIALLGLWANVVFGIRLFTARATHAATSRLLLSSYPELEGDGSPTVIRLTSNTLNAEYEGVRVNYTRHAGSYAAETPRGFVVAYKDMVTSIPVRGLDSAVVARLRACLSDWGLPDNLGTAAPAAAVPGLRHPTFALNLGGFIGAGFWAAVAVAHWTPGAAPARQPSAPERVSMAVVGQTLSVAGEDVPVRYGRFTARGLSGRLHDSLRGGITIAQARGGFYIERQSNGFSAFTLARVPRTSWNGPDSIGSIPDDAQVSALPGDGALIEWLRSANDGELHSCALLYTYRDAVPLQQSTYRRAIRLEVCSATLAPAALASWMQEAADAVDATFLDLAQR